MRAKDFIYDELSGGSLAFCKVALPTLRHQVSLIYADYAEVSCLKEEDIRPYLDGYIERPPMPVSFGTKNSVHHEGSYLFLHLYGRFFHDFLDNFSYAMALKLSGEVFTLVFVLPYKSIVYPRVGFPGGMLYGDNEAVPGFSVYRQAFQYMVSMLEMLDLPFKFISAEKLDGASCDFAYIPLIKSPAPLNEAIDYLSYVQRGEAVQSSLPESLKNLDGGYVPVGPFTFRSSSDVVLSQVKILRKLFTPETPTEGKIYISRAKFADRHNSLEPELEKYLESIGYEIVHLEDYPVREQIRLVTTATSVVMFSGGSQALSYLCGPKTSVVWLRPSSYELHAEKDMAVYFSEIGFQPKIIDFNESKENVLDLVKAKILY
jgi:hypothetical protein